ncbi:Na(+)/H(+) antiporter subunit B [Actinopolymorpha singaporensis]|uniref:Uncharacterized MnhB-related membrane protein n=1 Tax=Actinopolymorpha singaporensis TaxID=117157 RepID=A0A1H1TG85_9ACTN|nr:DUF4040 domain-containing protein [Actinopolymorpha singaporensis]SDS59071.1 Uncharacterized MnhB-related membrane protein [Actinopolymorpha singaporensis]
MFWVLDFTCLAVILGAAVMVVFLRTLTGAVVALSTVGTVLTLLFVVLGAPDVAHAEVAVGAIALPVLFLVAIGKVRTVVEPDQVGEPPVDYPPDPNRTDATGRSEGTGRAGGPERSGG